MKYQPERDLELAAAELKTVSPSALAKWVLNKRNKQISPEAIIMYLKRNPDVAAKLAEVVNNLSPSNAQPVNQALFENGNFKEAQSIKEWILYMKTRRRKGKPLKEEYIVQQIAGVKAMCKAYNKHPDRVTFRDAQEIFTAEEEKGKDTYYFRRVFKDFLRSKGAEGWEKIGVGKPRGFGTYKDMKIPKETAQKMINWLDTQNSEVGVATDLMLHTALRLNAVMTADVSNYFTENGWRRLKVLEKFREWKTFKVVPEVASKIDKIIAGRQSGRIFFASMKIETAKDLMATLNNKAIDLFCPELRLKYHHIHPNHFWRHVAIQLLLDLSGRNSEAVAAVVQCTKQSLDESYGAATTADIERWEAEYLSML